MCNREISALDCNGGVIVITWQCPRNDFQSAQVILLPRSPKEAAPMLPHILGGEFLQSLKVWMNRVFILWGP